MTSTLSLRLVGALAAGGLLAAGLAASAPGGATTSTRPSTATSTATSTSAIRSLTVDVSQGVVTMPSRLLASTYYVHVTTKDANASLQVVRRPATLSVSTWYQRLLACSTYSPGETQQTSLRQCRYWRTSATFVGGANVVRTSRSGFFPNPGGRATFAITLTPGQYWFYQDSGGEPWDGGKAAPLSSIRIVTVVGTAERAPVPVAAVARFADNRVTLPRTIPRRGFLLGVGQRGIINRAGFARIKPGITDEQIVAFGVCFNSLSGITELSCFDGSAVVGGGVSGGASALWWYDLPPGEYIAFQAGTNEAGDSGLYPEPLVTRVTVR